ncbi:MAG TPA: hypothetical protein VHX38_36045 [Pseudonocardiaceae bacterium]|jgi:hypothetical protein|nr:hypothetical protein [Pseudonocardiaceae bacterium]
MSQPLAAGRRPALSAAPLDEELAVALRDGPFHLALDLAVRRRQVSLEGLQRRLAEGGLRIGISTLSYWRRGHRHPEGHRSVRALQLLEGILDLPANSLLMLASVGNDRSLVRRPSGTLGLDAALGLTPERTAALSGIDPDVNLRLNLLAVHLDVTVDADGMERSLAARFVVSSKVADADRFVCLYETRAGEGSKAVVDRTGSCRVGRIRTEPGHGLLAAELLFDRRLRLGEAYAFDYVVTRIGEPNRSGCFEYGLRLPCPQLVLRIQFSPGAVPVGCYRYYRPGQDPVESTVEELPIGSSLGVHAITLNGQQGVHGIRWDWS